MCTKSALLVRLRERSCKAWLTTSRRTGQCVDQFRRDLSTKCLLRRLEVNGAVEASQKLPYFRIYQKALVNPGVIQLSGDAEVGTERSMPRIQLHRAHA